MTRLLTALLALPLLCALPAQAQTTKLTLLLDWFVNPDHAPLFVAQERGYFREAGIELEMIPPTDPNDPPKLVAAGRADLAVSYQPQLTLHASQGLPLVRVGTLVATPLNSIMVLRESPIRSIADLKGKRIGYSVGAFDEVLLKGMFEKHGMTLGDVTLINVNFSLSPALLAGRVDAVLGAFRNFELNQLDIEGRPGRAFYVEEEGVPVYDELILVANRARIADPVLRRVVDAIERGTLSLINRPDEAWALFIKGRPTLDDELNRRAWRDTLPRFAHSPAALDRARYERFAAFLVKQGLIPAAPPLESYAVELR